MTAPTGIDPRLQWFENLDLGTSMLAQSKEEELRSNNGQSETSTPMAMSNHRRLTSQENHPLGFHFPLDWTPEMRLSGQTNAFTPWLANQSTPTRSSSTNKNRQPFAVLLGQTESQSPTRLNALTSSVKDTEVVPNPLYTNVVRSGGGRKSSFTNSDHQANDKRSGNKVKKTTESVKMPPPPLPRHVQQKENEYPDKSYQNISKTIGSFSSFFQNNENKEHLLMGYRRQTPQSNTLPPQYRALYNASTVGPTKFAREVATVKPLKSPVVSQSLSQRTLMNKEALQTIASNLSERDAFSFALSCSTVYRALDDSWWKSTFPIQEEEQANKSAWVYLWPKSDGFCGFCFRWMRIVMHEPSKAHVCLDCMQLPHFKVIRFSAARMKFNLSNAIAILLLSQLPSVQDSNARYFWVCHLEWVAAHCRIADAVNEVPSNGTKASAEEESEQCHEDLEEARLLKRKAEVSQKDLKSNSRETKKKQPNQNVIRTLSCGEIGTSDLRDDDTTSVEHSSEMSYFDGYEDAEGDTDDEYNPDTTVESEPYTLTKEDKETKAKSKKEMTNNKRRTRTSTGTLTIKKKRRKDPIRRTKSSPFPDDFKQFEDSDVEGEDVESRQRRISEIMRDVRKDYLIKEIEQLGSQLTDLNKIPYMFINGQWDEVQELGILQNDFKSMAKWMENKGMLSKNIEQKELEAKH